MPPLILLGAGASVDAGVPHAGAMTSKFLELADSKSLFGNQPYFCKVLRFVVGGLVNQKYIQGYAPEEVRINIEEVFSAIQMLRDREILEAAPFVGNWLAEIADLDRLRPNREIESRLRRAASASERSYRQLVSPNIDIQEIFDLIASGMKSKGRAFDDTLSWMTNQLRNLTVIQNWDQNGAYYEDFVTNAFSAGVTVATLNYDNAIEEACLRRKISLDNGLSGWDGLSPLTFSKKALHLLKLHGSILWDRRWPTQKDDVKARIQCWATYSPDSTPPAHPEILFGGRNKLTARGPFLDLYEEFKRRLSATKHVTIVGYSFSDSHINELLFRWWKINAPLEAELHIFDLKPRSEILSLRPWRSQSLPAPSSISRISAKEALPMLYQKN